MQKFLRAAIRLLSFALLSTALITGYFNKDSFAQSADLKIQSAEPGATESIGEVGLALFPFNPLFMIEGSKFYFGLTKEVSLSLYPYGRVSGEYSFIFRETRVNHLRFSYNYDIPLVSSDFAAILLSLGGGYFTDFEKEGYFPQAKFEMILPITDYIVTGPYLKFRYTIMTREEDSNIADASLGLALTFSF